MTSASKQNDPFTPAPRWVKVVGVVAVVLIFIIVIVHLATGGLGGLHSADH